MSSKNPVVLHIPSSWLKRRKPLASVIHDAWPVSRSSMGFLLGCFSFRNDEKDFVLALLAQKPNLWIFRCNQRHFCGDFVIVDMSSPSPEHRRVVVLDLKQGAPRKRGGGGAGVQLRNAQTAVMYIAQQTRIIPHNTSYELLVGDRHAIQEDLSSVRLMRKRTCCRK